MPKRRITVTVDSELVDRVHQLSGAVALSALVNDALAAHVERLGRFAALRQLLDSWDERLGPPSAKSVAEAKAAFDELDGLAGPAADLDAQGVA